MSLFFISAPALAGDCSILYVTAGETCQTNPNKATYVNRINVSGVDAVLELSNTGTAVFDLDQVASITSHGKVSAVKNLYLEVLYTGNNQVKMIEIADGGELSVADYLIAVAHIQPPNIAPTLLSVSDGSLYVAGRGLTVHTGAGTALEATGANAFVKVKGETIINKINTSMSVFADGAIFKALNQAQLEFEQLTVSSGIVGVKEAIIIDTGASVTSTGVTTVDLSLSNDGVGITFAGNSLLSLGESAEENQRLAADRTKGQLNIGQDATVKSAWGISVTETDPTLVTDITIKGLVDSISDDFYGNVAIAGSTAQERVFIDGGTVRGNINLGAGNDALYLTSGLLETTLVDTGEGAGVFMGDGNDHFEATGGKIIAPTLDMGAGHDTALFTNNADISELPQINGGADGTADNTGEVTFKNMVLSGYTDEDVTDRTKGLNIYNWTTLNLNEHTTFQLTGDKLLSDSTTAAANNVINIDGTSTLVGESNIVANKTLWADVNNSGVISLSNNSALGDVWTIRGNYHGNNGLLVMDVELNDDNSQTDRLIIDGDTSGTTRVKVNNLGGTGAYTTEGILIIDVAGNSDGEFVQEGRIVGGANEYYLHKNGVSEAAQNDGNWYLRSQLDSVTPEPEEVLRPEPGAYMANHLAANTLFLMRLHDRLGETQYTDVLTGEQKVTSMWMRQIGGHNRSRDTRGQMKTQSNRYVVQIGGDVAQWSSNGLDRWHLGLMAGYANQHSNTESRLTKHQSRGKVEGYSAGVYGTWYANDEEKTGSYIDTWALYNWFDNEVKGDEFATEKYKSRGVTASVEAGYTFKLGEREFDSVKYFLQPKAQVTWMNVRSNDHTDADNYRISFDGDGNIQTRLGLRAYANGYSDIDKGKDRVFEPFIEANWIHNTKDFGATMAGSHNSIAGTKNIGELKLGAEGQLSRNLDLWGNVGQQVGDKGYSDTQVILGMKYRF